MCVSDVTRRMRPDSDEIPGDNIARDVGVIGSSTREATRADDGTCLYHTRPDVRILVTPF